jgi:hypothetical protein
VARQEADAKMDEETFFDENDDEVRATKGDCVLDWMKKNKIPLTKANYIKNPYWEANPDLDAGPMAMLPVELK